MEKRFDLVLLGATGFTGQLIARYIAQHIAGEGVTSWAIAGRNEQKLLQVKASLSGTLPEIVMANVEDMASLTALSAQTRVLMNAVGPFNWSWRKVVEACVQTGTHYADITGEPSFVADVFQTFDEKARAQGVCVVNCCGFDSIPADYAAWITARSLPADLPKKVQAFVRTNAHFSGGTLTTAIHALYMESKGISIKTRIPRHPDAPAMKRRIHFSPVVNAWAIPMPVVDPHIVKRSAWRMPADYGAAFSYAQYFVRSSWWKVVKTVFPIAIAMVLVRFEWFRERMFRKYASGTGPDANQRAAARFEVTCEGSAGNHTVRTVMSGGDPGYDETAKMFSQAAFCLLKMPPGQQGGVLTPVEAFGEHLENRLKQEGIQINSLQSW